MEPAAPLAWVGSVLSFVPSSSHTLKQPVPAVVCYGSTDLSYLLVFALVLERHHRSDNNVCSWIVCRLSDDVLGHCS